MDTHAALLHRPPGGRAESRQAGLDLLGQLALTTGTRKDPLRFQRVARGVYRLRPQP